MTWSPAADPLLELARATGRGPRREGCFALWLVARVAEDLLHRTDEVGDRVQRRRVSALESRCSSLTVPAPLRRALSTALVTLREATPGAALLALTQLVAPASDVLGVKAASALTAMVRAGRTKVGPDHATIVAGVARDE